MKKIQFLTAISAMALMATAFGGCSHNKSREDSAAEQANVEQTQTQPESGSVSSEQASASGTTTSTDQQSQMEQGGQTGTTATTDTASTSTSAGSDQWSQLHGAALQNQMTNEMVLSKLHHINQKEIQMTQWATDKAQSQSVKSAIQQMSADHTALDSRVTTVAQQKNVQLRGFQAAEWEQAMMDRLQSLSGAQFDWAWTNAMRSGHAMTMQDLAWFSKQVKDPAIKRLVNETTVKVRAHHKMMGSMTRSLASDAKSMPSHSDMSDTPDSMQTQPSVERGGMSEDAGTTSESPSDAQSTDVTPSHENEQQ